MTKKLNLLPDEEFLLFGIIYQGKDYRLCFEINRKMEMDFQKDKDLEIIVGKQKDASSFSIYFYEEDENRLFYILSNKGTAALLVPEQKQMDYFLMVKGEMQEKEKKELVQTLRDVPGVQGAYEMDVKKLKSKQNLVF